MNDDPRRTILRGGVVVDGVAPVRRRADVAIVGERITAVGAIEAEADDLVVDCAGRLILPGFIDAHAHADGALFRRDVQHALLRQGVTTVVGGQDGVSYAPGDGVWASRYFAAINGPHPTYAGGGVAELLASYDGTTRLNAAYLVPAGTVRHEVMGMSTDAATPADLAAMQTLVADGLEAGALGLSSGLDYVPGIFAGTEELAALCEPVAAAGGLYVTHMRGGYEANSETGLREVAAIALHSGVRAHVSHLHLDADDAHRLLGQLAADGVEITFDMYPYTRGCTLVSMAVLPPEYSALDVETALTRLQDDAERDQLAHEWFPTVADRPSLGPDWPHMITVGHTPHPDWSWVQGLTLAEIADRRGSDVVAATLDLLVAGRLEVNAVMAVRDERPIENLARLFAHEAHMGGSDGIWIGAVPHPRAAGTFGRYLATYVDAAFSWTGAAQHLAGRTAARFGLGDRGAVRPGWIADLAVVDPTAVSDAATYEDPHALTVGIDDVFVAGVRVLADGDLTDHLPGRGLRRSAPSR